MLEKFKNLSLFKKLGIGFLILMFFPMSLLILAGMGIYYNTKNSKIKNLIMYLKKFSLGFLFFFLGAMFAVPFVEQSPEYVQAINEKAQIEEQLKISNEELSVSDSEISKIKSDRDNLLLQKTEIINRTQLVQGEIDKLNQDKIAKEEADRIAKEEADRIAKEEAEKQQQTIASSNKPSTGTSSGGSGTSGSSTNSGTISNGSNSGGNTAVEPIGGMVWRTATGSKYHIRNNCGKTNPANARKVTLAEAKAAGLTACSKCY